MCDEVSRFFVAQILDTLLGTPMIFYPHPFSFRVDEAVCVRAESVHVAVGCRDASVGHDDRDLMKGFGKHGPEVPIRLWRTEVGLRITLHGMVQVGELEWVSDKEDRRIVSYQVPVAFLGIEFHGKSTDVPFGISSPSFTCHGREAHEYFRLLPDFGEEFGTSILGYVVRHGEVSEGSATLSMHSSFGNDFPIEVRQFLNEPCIFQKDRTMFSCGE